MRAGLWGSTALAAWLAVLMAACGGRGVPVQSPVTVPGAGNMALTEQVLLSTLPQRSWVVDAVQPGRVLATLPVRTHLLHVEIRYDPQQVAVYYVNSANLAEQLDSEGRLYAHKKVNSWISRLARDIERGLADALQVSAGGMAMPPAAPLTPQVAPPVAYPPSPPPAPAPAQ